MNKLRNNIDGEKTEMGKMEHLAQCGKKGSWHLDKI